jgi:hypothetical protein
MCTHVRLLTLCIEVSFFEQLSLLGTNSILCGSRGFVHALHSLAQQNHRQNVSTADDNICHIADIHVCTLCYAMLYML